MTDRKGNKPNNDDGPQDPSKRRFLKVAGTGAAVAATGGAKVPVQIAAAVPVIKEAVGKAVGGAMKGLIPKELLKILSGIERIWDFEPTKLFRKGNFIERIEKVFLLKEFERDGNGILNVSFLKTLHDVLGYNLAYSYTNKMTIKDFFNEDVFDYFNEEYSYEEDDDNYDEDGKLIPEVKKDIPEELKKAKARLLEITGLEETDTITEIGEKIINIEIRFYEQYIRELKALNLYKYGVSNKEELLSIIHSVCSAYHNGKYINGEYSYRGYNRGEFFYLKDGVVLKFRGNYQYLSREDKERFSEELKSILIDLDKRLFEIETPEREEWERKQKEEEEKREREWEKQRREEEEKRRAEARKKREAQNENMSSRENFECTIKETKEKWFEGLDKTFTITKKPIWGQNQELKIVDVRKYFEQILAEIYNKEVVEGYGESFETYKNGFSMLYMEEETGKDSIQVVTSNMGIVNFLRDKIKKKEPLMIPNKSFEDPNKYDYDEELKAILGEEEE